MVAAAAVSALVRPGRARAGAGAGLHVHPDPRPGITGARVLGADQLESAPHLAGLFEQIREIPQIADGIGCYCGCAQVPGYRSLLSCYEAPGMAQHCVVCQGQGKLAYRRFKEGQALDQIRRAIDARFGSGEPPPPVAAAGAHCGNSSRGVE